MRSSREPRQTLEKPLDTCGFRIGVIDAVGWLADVKQADISANRQART